MPFGITNATIVTFNNITNLTNFDGDPTQFFIKANHIMFNGWFWFIMLVLTWIILYKVINDKIDQPLINLMYAGIVVSIVSFFFRAVNMTQNGVVLGLINDFQMWIIPLVTALIAAIVWFIKD